MNFKKVLFIQLKMLGDILMLTPAIRAFKQRYPEALIDVIVQPPGEDLIRLNPYVNKVICFSHSKWYDFPRQFHSFKKIRKNKYDMAIDFLGNPRSCHYTFLTGAKKRLGYKDVRFSYAYNVKNRRIHGYSAISKIAFLDVLDVKNDDYSLEFHVDSGTETPSEFKKLKDKKLIAISPISYLKKKVWPTEKFAETASYINKTYGFYPVVIVGPGEEHFLDDYRKFSKCNYLPLQIDNIMVLGKILKKCTLFVGNDNGPKHIAVAMGIPTYTIYGEDSDPECWNYPNDFRHQYIGGMNKPDCMPIANIRMDIVRDKVTEFINCLDL